MFVHAPYRFLENSFKHKSDGLHAGFIYEWDRQHGTVEKYNKRGKHLGEFDPNTGEQNKAADKTRRVDP